MVSWGGEVAVYIGLRPMVGKLWSVSYIIVRYKQLYTITHTDDILLLSMSCLN